MINHQHTMNEAQSLYKQRRFKEALNLLQDEIDSDNAELDTYFLMANIFHSRGELGKAIRAFNKVLEIEPNHTDASISLSVIYNDIGKYEKAKVAFDNANKNVQKKVELGLEDKHIDKKLSTKHLEIAEHYATYGRFEEAISEYKKAVELDPTNFEIRIKMAKSYAKKGFKNKAFEELRKLKSEQPSYIPARMALGLLHYSSGNILEAQTEWQNILLKDETHQEAKMYLDLSRAATETNIGPQ